VARVPGRGRSYSRRRLLNFCGFKNPVALEAIRVIIVVEDLFVLVESFTKLIFRGLKADLDDRGVSWARGNSLLLILLTTSEATAETTAAASEAASVATAATSEGAGGFHLVSGHAEGRLMLHHRVKIVDYVGVHEV